MRFLISCRICDFLNSDDRQRDFLTKNARILESHSEVQIFFE